MLLFINGLTPHDDVTNARAKTIQHEVLWHNPIECLRCTPKLTGSATDRVATLAMLLLDPRFRWSVVRLSALNRALLINSPLEQNNAFAQRLRFSQLNFNRDVASPQAPGGLVQKVCTSPEFGNACYPQVVVCRVGHISGTLDTSLLYDTNSRCCCGKGAWGSRFEFER